MHTLKHPLLSFPLSYGGFAHVDTSLAVTAEFSQQYKMINGKILYRPFFPQASFEKLIEAE